MQNHHEKARDMARSVLASTSRKGSRFERATIHHRERARSRRALHELAALADPDDFEGDLCWEDRCARFSMVSDRRDFDKVAPICRWAARTVATNPRLAVASVEERITYFRKRLPAGLIGDHALLHIEWAIENYKRFTD